jgi:predicted transcriptional regulator
MNRMEKKAVPVTDDARKLMGMLKYKDVVKAAQAGKGDERVKAWMRRDVVTVREDTPFDQLEKVLVDQQTGRLPVVDADGVLVGLVTRTDVLREHKLYGGLGRRVA